MAKRVPVEIPRALARKARRAAKEEGVSLGENVEHLLRRRLTEREFLEAFDRRAGTVEPEDNFDEILDAMRRDDPERA